MSQVFYPNGRPPLDGRTALDKVRRAMEGDFDIRNIRYKATARLSEHAPLGPNDLESSQYLSRSDE